jgi:hypothetical protein
VQRAGSAAGLPHLVPTEATTAKVSGSTPSPAPPKGALPADHRFRPVSSAATAPKPRAQPEPPAPRLVSTSLRTILEAKPLADSGTAGTMSIASVTYDASYAFAESPPKVDPPVLNDQAGNVKVKVTNKGSETWTPTNGYLLQYEVYDQAGQQVYHEPAQTPMPTNVANGQTVTVNATINPLPPGTWKVMFDMIHVTDFGYALFSDYGVPRTAQLSLTVPDLAPQLTAMYPYNNYQVASLRPVLFADGLTGDAWPSATLTYWFTFCKGPFLAWEWCESPPWQTSQVWRPPAGKLKWGEDYFWTVFVSDGGGASTPGPWFALETAVAQPSITAYPTCPAGPTRTAGSSTPWSATTPPRSPTPR